MALRAVVVAAALTLGLPARAQQSDPWLGPDKAAHFAAAALIAGAGFTVGALLLDSLAGRLGVGAALALSAGMGKELWDDRAGGDPSFRDLSWDAAGMLAGLAIGWTLVSVVEWRPRAGSTAPAAGDP